MMPPKGKGGLDLTIVAPVPGKKGAPSSGKMPAAGGDDFDMAAQHVWDAVKDDDAEGFKMALKAAIAACDTDDYDVPAEG